MLDYFDAFTIGLTATPNKQAFGFFNQNLVMEYGHEQAVADGVNVDFDVYRIRTEITEQGSTIDAGIVTQFRDRQTRRTRWEKLDEDLAYTAQQLDRAVVARDQIRTVLEVFRDRLFTEIFPGRSEVPKTLIFAKDDAHADEIAPADEARSLRLQRARDRHVDLVCLQIWKAAQGRQDGESVRGRGAPLCFEDNGPRYMETHEVKAILDKLGKEFEPVAAACYFAALRISEALSLTWDAVDFDGGRIDVRAGKTKASINSAPLPLPLAKILRAHRQRQVDAGQFEIGGLVFKTRTGRPQSRRNALRAVNVASESVGLWSEEDGREPVGLHDLRHSAANFYFQQGVKTRAVSRLLRHANPVVTQVVYGGIAPAEEEEILNDAVTAFGGV